MLRLPRKLGLFGGAAALAAGGFAFMASNTFTNHPAAGAGTTTVSGFTISTASFTACGVTTNATNPEDICYAHFYVSPMAATAPTAGYVYVKFSTPTTGTTGWYACTATTTYKPTTTKTRWIMCNMQTNPLYPGTVTAMTVSAVDNHKP